MSTNAILVVLGAFLASAVEMVEAVTIVLAMGIARSWRSALIGSAAALLALAIAVAILGPLLTAIPQHALSVVIGSLLLVFGLQWLKKAVLRYAGRKALHDERAIYEQELVDARAAGHEEKAGMDWYAFVVSFKGVFLEGLEVAFIVLVFGRAHGSIPLAAIGAIAGCIVVGLVASVVRTPLSRVPENTIKYSVGILLTVFGTLWTGEGLGVHWPGGSLAILWLIGIMLLASWAMVVRLRIPHADPLLSQPAIETLDLGKGH